MYILFYVRLFGNKICVVKQAIGMVWWVNTEGPVTLHSLEDHSPYLMGIFPLLSSSSQTCFISYLLTALINSIDLPI